MAGSPAVTVAESPPAGTDTAKSVPVPVRLADCGVSGVLSAMLRVALRCPAAVGVNVTLTAQVPLEATLAPEQLSALLAKSPGFVPAIVTVEIVRSAAPELVTVTVCAVLVVPTG